MSFTIYDSGSSKKDRHLAYYNKDSKKSKNIDKRREEIQSKFKIENKKNQDKLDKNPDKLDKNPDKLDKNPDKNYNSTPVNKPVISSGWDE